MAHNKWLKDFRDFAVKGNVIDLAIAVVMGGAFGAIVKSIVDDIIMPPIGLLLGGVDFANLFAVIKQGDPVGPYASLSAAQEAAAVTINYGLFLSALVTFLIIAFVMFLLVKSIAKMQALVKKEEAALPAEPTTKQCPFCCTDIPIKASRCPHCTSKLEE
ncbi:MAG: large conductance mechanosensitive channel protein MscL [Anaerolineae bacterium]|nr:large conductance mechanosensitive channel protein MscL [Anaerolineae bacterium]